MTVNEISKKIKKLSFDAHIQNNEPNIRVTAQNLFMLTEGCEAQPQLLDELRVALRPLMLKCILEGDTVCELNSLTEEYCLAINFYLLQKEKRIYVFESEDDIFTSVNFRAFENRFFFLAACLLKTNDTISVEIRDAGRYAAVIFRAEKITSEFPEDCLMLFGRDETAVCIRLEKSEPAAERREADFSLLLSDRLSPLQIWFCDFE